MFREILENNGLTEKEMLVTSFVVQGYPNKEVANHLFVTDKTVKFHLSNIYKKMNVKSRAQLIVKVLGLVNNWPSSKAIQGVETQGAVK